MFPILVDGHSWDDQSLQLGSPVVATWYLQGRDARAVDHDGTCANQRTDAYLGVFLAGKVGLMFHTYINMIMIYIYVIIYICNYIYICIYLFSFLLPMMEVEHTPCSKGNDFFPQGSCSTSLTQRISWFFMFSLLCFGQLNATIVWCHQCLPHLVRCRMLSL